ncbi:hypothetical protein CLOM_g3836 [Closterium sp. NIES-68]|nr:hypothetical protein CLOM_g3836 [Closterium sp. NIES-68]GJP68149.1 hypothetical protein CLOP_g24889 [Closterium sp. NIES-67]
MENSSGDNPPTNLYIDPEASGDNTLQPSADSSLPSSSTPAERRCAVCSCKLPTSSLRSAKSLPAPKHFKFDLRERDDDDDDDDDDENSPSRRGGRGEEQKVMAASSPSVSPNIVPRRITQVSGSPLLCSHCAPRKSRQVHFADLDEKFSRLTVKTRVSKPSSFSSEIEFDDPDPDFLNIRDKRLKSESGAALVRTRSSSSAGSLGYDSESTGALSADRGRRDESSFADSFSEGWEGPSSCSSFSGGAFSRSSSIGSGGEGMGEGGKTVQERRGKSKLKSVTLDLARTNSESLNEKREQVLGTSCGTPKLEKSETL